MSTTEPAKDLSQSDDALPFSLLLELTVHDPEVISELWGRPEGKERDDFALAALRLGVLALRQARGQVDADAIRRAGERLMGDVQAALSDHRTHLDRSLNGTLTDYFDPKSGRFSERIERLLKKDGDLESLLARKITAEDSEMCKSLVAHVGKDSPLFRLLSPTESEGLLKSLCAAVATELEQQRQKVLKEFSLDNKEGALTRVVEQLTDSNGKLKNDLKDKVDEIVKQFSFDDKESAISKMKLTVDNTKDAISQHLTLDDEKSALSRLRRELMDVLETHGKEARSFQEEVRVALETMKARRKEAEASTRHGIDFEQQVSGVIEAEAQRLRDVATHVGSTTGLIKNCKRGDVIVELGPESPAPGARFVAEAKEVASYELAHALCEIEEARKNRSAEIGLFVFSKRTAPEGLEPLARYGLDVVVVWDADDLTTDVYLKLGFSVARALCTQKALEKESLAVDFSEIDKALLEIKKHVDQLDDIRKYAETINSSGEKILNRLRISRKALSAQADTLAERVADLKQSMPLAAI